MCIAKTDGSPLGEKGSPLNPILKLLIFLDNDDGSGDDLVYQLSSAVLWAEFGFGAGGAGHGVINIKALGIDVDNSAGFEAAVGSGAGVEDAG